MMARVSDQQAFAGRAAVRERFKYSSAQAFKSRFALRRHRNQCGVIRKRSDLLGESRSRESWKVAFVQRNDMTSMTDFSQYQQVFFAQRFRAVHDYDQKISVCRFATSARHTHRLDLITRGADAGGVNQQNREAVNAQRLCKRVSSRSRNLGHDSPIVSQ